MILTPERALENIRKAKLSPGYLLLGREVYWRDQIWAALRSATGLDRGPDGLSEFDLRQNSLDQILEKAAERSLWFPRQLLLVRGSQALTPTKGLDKLAAYFQDSSPFATLVFEATDVDLDSEDWRERDKAKSRQEAWGGLCDVVCLTAPGVGEAVQWVQQEAARSGRAISPQVAAMLVAALDRNMGRLVLELEKLCLYNPDEKQISSQEVVALVGGATAQAGLSLSDAIASGDPRQVLEAIALLERKGSYLPLIVAEVARTLRQLLVLQQSRARDPRQAAKLLWAARMPAPEHALPALLRLARAVSTEHLVRCLRRAFQTDLALRSSPADERLLLERFALEILRSPTTT